MLITFSVDLFLLSLTGGETSLPLISAYFARFAWRLRRDDWLSLSTLNIAIYCWTVGVYISGFDLLVFLFDANFLLSFGCWRLEAGRSECACCMELYPLLSKLTLLSLRSPLLSAPFSLFMCFFIILSWVSFRYSTFSKGGAPRCFLLPPF